MNVNGKDLTPEQILELALGRRVKIVNHHTVQFIEQPVQDLPEISHVFMNRQHVHADRPLEQLYLTAWLTQH